MSYGVSLLLYRNFDVLGLRISFILFNFFFFFFALENRQTTFFIYSRIRISIKKEKIIFTSIAEYFSLFKKERENSSNKVAVRLFSPSQHFLAHILFAIVSRTDVTRGVLIFQSQLSYTAVRNNWSKACVVAALSNELPIRFVRANDKFVQPSQNSRTISK